MPRQSRVLPQGRGAWRGANSVVGQTESYQSRGSQIPDAGGWVLSNAGPWDVIENATGFVAVHTVLTYLGDIARVYTLSEARIYVTAAAASNIFRSALYTYEPATREFVMVAGSNANFPTDSTGIVTAKLPKGATTYPNKRYFMGFRAGSATVGISGSNSGSRGLHPLIFIGDAATDPLQKRIPNDATFKTTLTEIAHVVYLSAEAATVL